MLVVRFAFASVVFGVRIQGGLLGFADISIACALDGLDVRRSCWSHLPTDSRCWRRCVLMGGGLTGSRR
jgi:hypothetical protein